MKSIVCWTICLIFLGIISGCGIKHWSKKDQTLFGSFTVLNAIDAAQYDKDNELNWFKGQSQGTVCFIKIAGIGIIYLIADNWKDARTPVLTVGNVLMGGIIIRNEGEK